MCDPGIWSCVLGSVLGLRLPHWLRSAAAPPPCVLSGLVLGLVWVWVGVCALDVLLLGVQSPVCVWSLDLLVGFGFGFGFALLAALCCCSSALCPLEVGFWLGLGVGWGWCSRRPAARRTVPCVSLEPGLELDLLHGVLCIVVWCVCVWCFVAWCVVLCHGRTAAWRGLAWRGGVWGVAFGVWCV